MKVYKHLSFEERVKIALWQEEGLSAAEIAEELGRDKSTIYREIQRNSDPETGRYMPKKAQYTYRRRIKTSQGRIRDQERRMYVKNKLLSGWSPERISGRIKKEMPCRSVSHETVYMFVYKEEPGLRGCLPRHHMKRHKKWQRKSHNKSHISNRVLIDFRPERINNRFEFGHWKSDIMMSIKAKNSGLTFIVERKSRYSIVRKACYITAQNNKRNIMGMMKSIPENARHSITYDNGYENALHEEINRAIGCDSYFCNDGKPYEKGTVENTIGLARRMFPKGTDFDKINAGKIRKLENWLNDLPKKCLGWQTPREAFNQLCCT